MNPSAGDRHLGPITPTASEWDRVARIAWAALLIAGIVAVVSAVYLGPFLDDPARFPHGIDTPGHIQRSRLIYEEGLNRLEAYGERPAHPIVTSVLRDVTGGDALDLAKAWPAVFATSVGLAAAALAAGIAGERRWVGASVGIGLAVSPFVALTAIGSASNLLLDVFAVAALALAVGVRTTGRGMAGLVVLLGATAIAHWVFAIPFATLLGTYTIGVLATTWARRRTAGTWGNPGRLAVAVGLGTLLGIFLFLGAPDRPHRVPFPRQRNAAMKIERRVPEMRLSVTIPLTGLGVTAMWLSRRPASRRVAVPLAMWALAAPVSLIAWRLFDMPIPHRIAPFALSIPILILLGAAATRSWTDAMGVRQDRRTWVRPGAVVSATLVIAGATWFAVRGIDTWEHPRAAYTEEQFQQGSIVAAYRQTLPPRTPFVIPMRPGFWSLIRPLQVILPPLDYQEVTVWRENFNGDTTGFRRRLAARFPRGTAALWLSGYSEQPPLSGTRLGPGVILLAGPKPAGTLSVAPLPVTPASELIRITLIALVAASLLGLGWAISLTGLPAFAAVCISPAMGLAVLSIGGLVAGRLGFPLGEGGGAITALSIASLGWLALLVRSRWAFLREESTEQELPPRFAVESVQAKR